jgi:metal-sulfur cluster biosynthetic enzyme
VPKIEDTVRQEVEDVVAQVVDPCSTSAGTPMTMREMGLLKSVSVEGDAAVVEMRLTAPSCPMVPYFLDAIERGVADLHGIERVILRTDGGHDWDRSHIDPAAEARRTTLILRRREELG